MNSDEDRPAGSPGPASATAAAEGGRDLPGSAAVAGEAGAPLGSRGPSADGSAARASVGDVAAGSGGGEAPPDDPSGDGHGGGESRRPRGGFLRELPFLVVVAFALALIIKAFLVQAFYIPSGSMEQTLEIRDRVLVNKLVYRFRDVHRGEVVVFNGAGSFSPDPGQEIFAEPTNPVRKVAQKVGSLLGLGAPGEKDFIKRVIGTPGDRVACCTNGHVTVQPPGGQPVQLAEPYVYQNDSPMVFCEAGTDPSSCPAGAPGVLVPAGRLFVMGDHRCCSSDSRLHLDDGNNGTVPEDEVIGRAFVVVWPFDRAKVLHVPDTFGGGSLALPATAAVQGAPYALGAVGVLPLGLWRRRRRAVLARPAA